MSKLSLSRTIFFQWCKLYFHIKSVCGKCWGLNILWSKILSKQRLRRGHEHCSHLHSEKVIQSLSLSNWQKYSTYYKPHWWFVRYGPIDTRQKIKLKQIWILQCVLLPSSLFCASFACQTSPSFSKHKSTKQTSKEEVCNAEEKKVIAKYPCPWKRSAEKAGVISLEMMTALDTWFYYLVLSLHSIFHVNKLCMN